jgi:hypothetical protein
MKRFGTLKTTILNILLILMFGWVLHQGCVKDRVSTEPAFEEDPVEQTISVPVTLVPQFRLPSILMESSGIIMTSPGKLWSHNDSGNENKLYCFDLSGSLIRTITVSNSSNVDWEDLAIDNQKRIYISDAGNNENRRTDLVIYRIPDPESFHTSTVTAELIRFKYEDQSSYPPPASSRNFDMEAVVWHNDSLFLFTKDRTSPLAGFTKMYKLPATPGTHVARAAGSFYLGTTNATARVTAADIHTASGKLALLVQNRLIVFTNYQGSRFFYGKVINYPFTQLPGQAEALFFVSDSRLYITEEGSAGKAGYLYEVILPEN